MNVSSPPRSPRRDAAENREALLAAGRRVLNRDPNATLQTIAAEAGLSRRAFYGHFDSRDELVLELVTSGARRVASALAGVTHPDPLTRLALIASHLWKEVESVRAIAVIAVRGPLAPHTASAFSALRTEVRGAITAGRLNGTVRTDIAEDRLARLVEGIALVVLQESTSQPLTASAGHDLVMLMTLAAAGLSSSQSRDFIDRTLDLQWEASQ